MRRRIVIAALFVAACGTQSDGPVEPSPPYSNAEEPNPDGSSSSTHKPRRMRAKITTVGDIADALGIHSDFLYATNNACSHLRDCGRDFGEGLDESSCDVILAQEWCRTNDCSQGFLTPPVWDDPCVTDIRSRSCDDLGRAVQCDALRSAGIELYLNAWPEGKVEDPWKTWLRDL